MAVLRQELTRTTFQDRQIKLMTDISGDIRKLDKDVSKGFLDLKHYVDTINGSIQGLYYSFVRYFETGTAAFVSDLEDAMDDLRDGIDEDTRERERDSEGVHQRQADRYQNYINQQNKTLADRLGTIAHGIMNILNIFNLSLDQFMSKADTLSDLVNTAVRNTGLSRDAINGLQETVWSTVGEMNERTNNLYSPMESMELMVGMINQTGIKNLEFYEEYAEIFLETQKTMNINLGSLAEFSDKFYRKYNFSSATMEELTENIRKNTAGTSVSEDKMMSFMQEIDSDLMSYAIRMGGNTEANYSQLQENVTGVYSWLNSQGYDSDYLFKLITGAASGGATSSEYETLAKLGIRTSPDQLMNQLMKDPASLMTNLINRLATSNFATRFGSNGRFMASQYGIDYDTAMLAAYRGGINRSSYDEFMRNRQASTDPEAQIWLSATDRTANASEMIVDDLKNMQEKFGIRLSEISSIIGVIKDVIVGVFGASVTTKLWDFFTRGLGAGAGSFGITGALGIGAAAIGIAAIVSGIYEGVKVIAGIDNLGKETFTVDPNVDLSKPIYITSEGFTNDSSAPTLSGKAYQTMQADTLESHTGVRTHRPGDDFWTDAGNVGLNTLRAFTGTGYWKENASWDDYIPIWGGIKNLVAHMSGESKVYSHENSSQINSTMSSINQYMSKEGVTLFKVLWALLSQNGGEALKFSTPLYDNINKYGDMVMKGHVPISIDDKGKVLQHVSVDGTGGYADYIRMYQEGNIPLYKQGTPYIPDDQVALLHQGEAVIPAQENPFNKYNNSRNNTLQVLTESTQRIEKTTGSEISKIADYLRSILAFLEYWKDDNNSRDDLNGVLETARNMSLKLQFVTGDSVDFAEGVG